MLANKVISKITAFEKILIMIHEEPDGDTLAAASAMYLVLRKMSKSPEMVCKDEVPLTVYSAITFVSSFFKPRPADIGVVKSCLIFTSYPKFELKRP